MINRNVKIDDQHIIEEILRRRRSGVSSPAIPARHVRKFLMLVGGEIKRDGELRKHVVERLLRQLKAGEI